MHPATREWFSRHRSRYCSSILEFGGLDVNGNLLDFVPEGAEYTCVDLVAGPGVTIVADAATYEHPKKVDEIWCANVLEHAENWREIIASAARNLRDGGRLILSCAGPGFKEHGAWGDAAVLPGEHYRNINVAELAEVLEEHFEEHSIVLEGSDLMAIAVR